MRLKLLSRLICLVLLAVGVLAPAQESPRQTPWSPSRADILRGEYSYWRANNDLLSYDLDIRVDPVKKFISGVNTIRFKMLRDDTRIQIDLFANLAVDRIDLRGQVLPYEREGNVVFVSFPGGLKKGQTYDIQFRYSGNPLETGRFGCFTFKQDPKGRPWINTACEEVGASVWWPNKDQWRDEPDEMWMRVAVPNDLMDVSN